ncbi:hypothetical protein BDN67DRAFT_1070501 [Paxillus ammoniavirescens]|nr:hypothetical protein BDN67DRAFT_1070501 [Paxillus ammoniavirescens]
MHRPGSIRFSEAGPPPYSAKKESWLRNVLGVKLPPRVVPKGEANDHALTRNRSESGKKSVVLIAGLVLVAAMRQGGWRFFDR